MTTADLKALIQSETTFSSTSQHLYHNGQLLNDEAKTMEELSIGDGEMLAMHVRDMSSGSGVPSGGASARGPGQASSGPRPPPPRGSGGGGSGAGGERAGPDPEMIRLQILGDPRGRQEVRNQNPELADAVEDPARFRQLFQQMQRQQADADRNRQREIAMLNDDPFNADAQVKIEELIRQEAVMENLQNALEHNPEAFGKVTMLYIDVEVNGHKVKAFVDSGAQATIMSPSCAEACGIMRLVDRRFAGIARGVGTAKILGRVHTAQIRIGTVFLDCSFTVMEGKDVDLLLGLDMLKRHQACIDLTTGVLSLQGTQVPFLGEADIPGMQEEAMMNEPMVEGPGGTKVGAKTGAVHAAEGEASSSSAATGGPASTPGNFQGGGNTLGAASQSSQDASSGQVPQKPATQQASPPPQPPPPSRPAQAEAQHPPQAIEQLQQLGFSREEAIAALNATGGNVDYAAGLLFQ